MLHIMVLLSMMLAPSYGEALETVKVAAIFAKTGAAAAGNSSTLAGVRFAVQKLNHQGGLLKKQVQIVEFDNHSTALHSKQAAEEAVKAGVVAVFGANWSSHAIAMAPVLQAAHIPMLSPFSTSPDLTLVGDYIFRLCFIDSFQGRIMATYAFQDLQARTAAILINASGRYSEGLAEFFHKEFVTRGGKILVQTNYLHDTKDFSSYLKTIISLEPDVVFVPGHIVDSGRIIKQARQLGLSVPILGGDGWGKAMYNHVGSALHEAYFSEHWHKQNEHIKSREFVREFQEKFGQEARSGTALGYDAVFLFASAVRRAGSFEPDKVRNELASTKNFKGVTGNITFNEKRNPIKSAVISKLGNKTTIYIKTVEP